MPVGDGRGLRMLELEELFECSDSFSPSMRNRLLEEPKVLFMSPTNSHKQHLVRHKFPLRFSSFQSSDYDREKVAVW